MTKRGSQPTNNERKKVVQLHSHQSATQRNVRGPENKHNLNFNAFFLFGRTRIDNKQRPSAERRIDTISAPAHISEAKHARRERVFVRTTHTIITAMRWVKSAAGQINCSDIRVLQFRSRRWRWKPFRSLNFVCNFSYSRLPKCSAVWAQQLYRGL